jgi:di/tripeptidase
MVKRTIFKGWTVLDKNGVAKRYQFGHGVRELVVPTKKEAFEMARLLAERQDELDSGDINRWEFGRMRFAEVRRRGYRIVRADVVVTPSRVVSSRSSRLSP